MEGTLEQRGLEPEGNLEHGMLKLEGLRIWVSLQMIIWFNFVI